MGETTAIAWTDATFNPWWGCTRVSPGCQHCYAETFAKRTGKAVWGANTERRFFGDKHWEQPLKWDRAAQASGRRHLVFCASMADVFEDRADLVEERWRLWGHIIATPHLTWQLLTKRPENVRRMVPLHWVGIPGAWPKNVWIGTTVEDQKRADQRIPALLHVPAGTRFLSCEPLLDRVDLSHWLTDCVFDERHGGCQPSGEHGGIHWVIGGGESGGGHRSLDVDHARALRDQCAAAGVAFFFKQHGGRTPTAGGDLLDGIQYKEFPT